MAHQTETWTVTVAELQAHWARLEQAAVGEAVELFELPQMPPWEDICSQLDWEHHPLEGGPFSAKSQGFCGVYRLIALAVEDDAIKPAALSRLCGQDTSGTLYVGEASDLSNRLNQLRRSAGHPRERSHGAPSILRLIRRLEYPIERLGVALLFTGPGTRGIERDLILAYVNTFGDTPPLNYRVSL